MKRNTASRISTARRRSAMGLALALALLADGGDDALAQARGGRMDPGAREQLRHELGQQGQRAPRDAQAGNDRQRLSPQERQELRRQVREAGRPDERARGRGRN